MELESQLVRVIIRPAMSYAASCRERHLGYCYLSPPSRADGDGGLLSQGQYLSNAELIKVTHDRLIVKFDGFKRLKTLLPRLHGFHSR